VSIGLWRPPPRRFQWHLGIGQAQACTGLFLSEETCAVNRNASASGLRGGTRANASSESRIDFAWPGPLVISLKQVTTTYYHTGQERIIIKNI